MSWDDRPDTNFHCKLALFGKVVAQQQRAHWCVIVAENFQYVDVCRRCVMILWILSRPDPQSNRIRQ